MFEMEGPSCYDMPVVDSSERQVTIDVALIEDADGPHTGCALSSRDSSDSLTFPASFEWRVGSEYTCGA